MKLCELPGYLLKEGKCVYMWCVCSVSILTLLRLFSFLLLVLYTALIELPMPTVASMKS
jgi:hypothetical protein